MRGSHVTLQAPSLPAGPRSALVVGISRYEDPRFRTLRAPAGDARDLAGVLGDPKVGGFKVTPLLDATATELRVGVYDFLASRTRDETIVLYLSCHGVLTKRRDLYFVASDTQQDRLAAMVLEARWLNDRLDDCAARRQVVILDCCFSGAFTAAKDAANSDLEERLEETFASAESADSFMVQETESRGRVVLTASRATEYSFEGNGPTRGTPVGSVFTAALVEGIKTGGADQDNDGFVSAAEAYAYAYARVRRDNEEQHPQRWLFGGEGKDIVLARSLSGVSVKPAEIPQSLQDQLLGPYPTVRIAAVEQLARWLFDEDPARVIAARAFLKERVEQDISEVAQKIRWHLDQDQGSAQSASEPVNLDRKPKHRQQDDPAAILQNAENIARSTAEPRSAALGLTKVSLTAERAALANSTDLSSEAERIARGIPDLCERSMTLASMARVLAASDQRYARRLNNRAETIARSLEPGRERTLALAGVAETAAIYDPEHAESLASEIAPEVDREWDVMLSLAYGAIVTELGRSDPQRASKAANVRLDEFDKNQLLINLVESVSSISPGAAERIAANLLSDDEEVYAMIIQARMAAVKSPAYAGQIIRDALRFADAIPETDVRIKALTRITEAIAISNPSQAQQLVTEAAGLVRGMPDGQAKSWALTDVAAAQARMALLLISSDLDMAESLATSIEGLYRYKTLYDVSPLIVAKDRTRGERMIADAERDARGIADESTRVLALAWVAATALLVGYQPGQRLANEVEQLIPGLPDEDKAVALAKLASALARSDPDRAEQIAGTITRDATKARVLAGLARQIAPTKPDRAEQIANRITRDTTKARVLAGLARQIAPTKPDRAEKIAKRIPKGNGESEAFGIILDSLLAQVTNALEAGYSAAAS